MSCSCCQVAQERGEKGGVAALAVGSPVSAAACECKFLDVLIVFLSMADVPFELGQTKQIAIFVECTTWTDYTYQSTTAGDGREEGRAAAPLPPCLPSPTPPTRSSSPTATDGCEGAPPSHSNASRGPGRGPLRRGRGPSPRAFQFGGGAHPTHERGAWRKSNKNR